VAKFTFYKNISKFVTRKWIAPKVNNEKASKN
jgi:hypothetical protein